MHLMHHTENISIILLLDIRDADIIRIMAGAVDGLVSSHDKAITERLHGPVHFKRMDESLFKIALPVCAEILLHFFNLLRGYGIDISYKVVHYEPGIRVEAVIVLAYLPVACIGKFL